MLLAYKKACETVSTEDRPLEGAQFLESAGKLMVRVKKYDDAALILLNAIGLYNEAGAGSKAGRTVLKLVLVQLGRGDSVAAHKAYATYGGYCDSFQAQAAIQLTQGFTELDHEMAKKGLSNPHLLDLDNDFVKLARSLQPPAAANNNGGGDDSDGEIDLC